MSGYQRLDFPGGAPGQNPNNPQDPRLQDPRYQAHSPSPDPYGHMGRSPSPGTGLRQGYALQDRPIRDHMSPPPGPYQQPLQIPMGPGPQHPADRLQLQPTYSVENIPNSHGHNAQYNAAHPMSPMDDYHAPHQGDLALNPQAHHDAYYTDPYAPSPNEEHDQYIHNGSGQQYWQDEPDTRPLVHPDTSYGPDPYNMQPSPSHEDPPNGGYMNAAGEAQPAPQGGPLKRHKTVKTVQLFEGNLVLDCPIAPRLLNQIEHARPPERDEYTHMRYTAATGDPSEFFQRRFKLRQQLFAKPRHTELFICVTMYNEEDELFARTMMGVIKNIEYMNSRTNSKTWGTEAWKKIVVCVVSDGRAKINPRTRAVLAGLGVYQEGIAKQKVNDDDVTAHLYEYTTKMAIEIKKGVVGIKKGTTPVQMLFCLKEKNQKKINSHRWFFQAFGSVLNPNICVLIDAGTRPGNQSIYQLWKAFDIEPKCAGACGEIKAMLEHGKNLINPLVAAQNFEYKISNILDKPLESVFGFISVLPGAFSAYRYVALQNDKTGQGPLEKYFKGEQMHGANAGIFTANMYLAEDRILCFELIAKRNSHWILQYVKSATGETDVPTEMADFIMQRRRWLNGSFFAAVYATTHFYQIFRSNHSCIRKMVFLFEFLYQTFNQIFAWFAIGNFFLVFRILTTSLGDPHLLGTAGTILSVVFEWLYLVTLVTCFVLALGNRPQGSAKFYLTMVYFWVILMLYLMFAAVFIVVKSVEAQLAQHKFTVSLLFENKIFATLCISLAATYVLYFVMSFLFFDPWHMFTSFIQYLLLTPTYINILNVYAFCNTHDITWGTKGDDKPVKLGVANIKPTGGIDITVNEDHNDLNSQYESELMVFSRKFVVEKKKPSESDRQEDYYKGFRSAVVLIWMFCNLALCAVVLNLSSFHLKSSTDEEVTSSQNSIIYMAVVLYSVAGVSAVRFIGSTWFLILRLFRGV